MDFKAGKGGSRAAVSDPKKHTPPSRCSTQFLRYLARVWCGALLCLLPLYVGFVWATPPTLYGQPANESPVRADPDDLLLLPGYGFAASDRVVYAQLHDTTATLSHPSISSVPATPTAALGLADIISVADVPYTLAIRLPNITSQGFSYALWVVNAAGEWSNGVRINDARPLWITPDRAYTASSLANLPRVLKVVGRNLQPIPSGTTQVRLTGPSTYTLNAANTNASLSRYSAQVSLPSSMPIGSYSVQVSRDGTSWVALLGENGATAQTFQVMADPVSPPIVYVHDFACDPNDDTTCIVSAINSAASSHPSGATVVFDARTYRLFDPGTWSSNSNSSSKLVDFEGIWIPKHINLQGAGAGSTIVVRGTGWITPKFVPSGQTTPIHSLFNLQGNNTVQGFTFSDANVYTPSTTGPSAALRLGIDSNYAKEHSARRSDTLEHRHHTK